MLSLQRGGRANAADNRNEDEVTNNGEANAADNRNEDEATNNGEAYADIKVDLSAEIDTKNPVALTLVAIFVYNKIKDNYATALARSRDSASRDTVKKLSFFCELLIKCLKYCCVMDMSVSEGLLIPSTVAVSQFLRGTRNVQLPNVNWQAMDDANVLGTQAAPPAAAAATAAGSPKKTAPGVSPKVKKAIVEAAEGSRAPSAASSHSSGTKNSVSVGAH